MLPGPCKELLDFLRLGIEALGAQSRGHARFGSHRVNEKRPLRALYFFEEEGWTATTHHPVGDFSYLKYGIYLCLDALKLASGFQGGYEFLQTIKCHIRSIAVIPL